MPPPSRGRTPKRAARASRRSDRSSRARPRTAGYSAYERAARGRLKRFRRASALAVASTGLLLLVLGGPPEAASQTASADSAAQTAAADSATITTDSTLAVDTAVSASEAVQEAQGTLEDLGDTLVELGPKVGIALGLLALAALLGTLVKALLRRFVGRWERADALSAISSVVIWMLALSAALSVVAGGTTALVGFVGFFGLALSWALQAPIESFAGWLLNSFRGYYRVGDRIEVGDVFGDVARIDVLTTMVWEAGGPEKAVQAAQPTGALVTFPNSEILRANVINYTRDFPYVWDEVVLGIANRSDLTYAVAVFERIADEVVGEAMARPAEVYRRLLRRSVLDLEISAKPQVFVSPTESYANLTVRYLVPARERRAWATRLVLALSEELARPEHRGRIFDGYPVRQIERI